MALTRTQARDEIAALVKGVVDTLGTNFVAIYDDTKTDIPKANDTPLKTWARITVRHVGGAQTSLSDVSGQKRYTKTGLLTIQLFTPAGDGSTAADPLCDQFEAAFRDKSTPGGVWFRNPRSVEIGNDGPWWQTNILGDFQYEQFG